MQFADATIVRGQVPKVVQKVDANCDVTVIVPRDLPDKHVLLTVAFDAHRAGAKWLTVQRALHRKTIRMYDTVRFIESYGRKYLDSATGRYKVEML